MGEVSTPAWAAAALASARNAAAAAARAPIEVRNVGVPGKGTGIFATRNIGQGERIFREHPLAWAPSAQIGPGCTSLLLCDHCGAPAGCAERQLVCAGQSLGLQESDITTLEREFPDRQAEARLSCSGCGAEWCSERCRADACRWHAVLCEGQLRKIGRVSAAVALTTYRNIARDVGNIPYMLALRLLAQMCDLPLPPTGPESTAKPASTNWQELHGMSGARFWDTLRSADSCDLGIETQESAQDQEFRERVKHQVSYMAELLREILLDAPADKIAHRQGNGWLSTDGVGWIVGMLRQNTQAMRIDSPLPALIESLAFREFEDPSDLDKALYALQPLFDACRSTLTKHQIDVVHGNTVDAGTPCLSGGTEDDDNPLELPQIFPDANAIGLFLLQSGFNHSCVPNAVAFPALFGRGAEGSASPTRMGAGIEIVSLREICRGEELSVSYLADLQSAGSAELGDLFRAADRRSILQQQYLFKCDCSVCSAEVVKEN